MKERIIDLRTYDKEGFKRRAGCVCIKDERKSEVLLVSSSKYVNKWIIPGGAIEPGEDPVSAAVREVEEEAGVRGSVVGFLGIFQNDVSKSRTYIYILKVDNECTYMENKENRQIKWFAVQQALEELCHKPVQQKYLLKMMSKISTSGVEGNESYMENIIT
ncbi:diphosphoinositol polyphosphate phosphohydrolase 2-like isoform X1 [Rhopilema esculentum]|uniref:diphosphoinositol polyphosphate phosphohydrolase 2-like isoform X1 n=1 Tax=Rhopilema esculentum TaxID=499914 RepID=UPI0031D23D07|eukprot:gene17386-8981_t